MTLADTPSVMERCVLGALLPTREANGDDEPSAPKGGGADGVAGGSESDACVAVRCKPCDVALSGDSSVSIPSIEAPEASMSQR